jgi:hypothetical protein
MASARADVARDVKEATAASATAERRVLIDVNMMIPWIEEEERK